jgi:RimJ/RimL family protein N-acetyltransferase/predicted enzyme related to lactoylglutathione lyase
VLGEPEVAGWLRPAGRSGPYTPRETAEAAARDAAHWAAHGFGRWRVTDGDGDGDGTIAHGGLVHTLVNARPELEVTWAVAPARWGEGLAGEIGRRALERAGELGARSVVALTRMDNLASIRVMEKLGMVRETDFEHAGLPHVLHRAQVDRAGRREPARGVSLGRWVLRVDDEEAALDFYLGGLGFELLVEEARRSGLRLLHAGDGDRRGPALWLLRGRAAGGGPAVVLYAGDLDAALARAVAHGGRLGRGPRRERGSRYAHVLDPAGNELIVVELDAEEAESVAAVAQAPGHP